MRNLFLGAVCTMMVFVAAAQPGGGGNRGGRFGGQNASVGHFYGKLVDSKTNKPVDGATVQLYGNRFDSATQKMKPAILKTVLAASNGDFSLDGLPVFGNFTLKVAALGYKPYEKNVKFDIKMGDRSGNAGGQEGGTGDAMQRIAGMTDIDLGNIKLEASAEDLGNVTVTATKQLFEMGIDRKTFNVDKNLVSTGQTATEVMKQIPSLNVDIDGNVTMRNASPQIFVDGRPTTLTLDQIPADIIDKVELITNPSAKYDASGGGAGILNIVLKKNKKTGYNGGIRTGVDSRGRYNIGGDLNLRQNKINFFLNGTYNQRKSKSTSVADRYNNLSEPSDVYQDSKSTNSGYFGFLRGGFDYFIDNRNTLSLSANYNKGEFKNNQDQTIDSTIQGLSPYPYTSTTNAFTNSTNNFKNFGTQLSFRHNFEKNGHDITADVNYNSSDNNSLSTLTSNTYPQYAGKYPQQLQQTFGDGYNHFLTLQSDYENPITENSKIEAGVRGAIRNFKNANDIFLYNNATDSYDFLKTASSKYKFTDQVYAAYGTYSFKVKKWSYLLGLRVESSNYKGTLLNEAGQDSISYKVNYPLSLFPSAFVTYKIDAKQDLQLNYSRRINRPSFFQLMPFADYSDPQNITTGNAGLKPEFTQSFEVSYSNAYKKGSNFLASAYLKYTNDLITRYTYRDVDQRTGDSATFLSYINANNSYTYGIELTNKMPVTKWWDLTLNFNLYNSIINADLPNAASVSNSQVSWFAKMNSNFKIAKGWSIQFSGDYQAKTVLPQSGGSGRGGPGGGMFGGGPQATAQGYLYPRYSFDGAIRKDWTWKNGQSGSLTLSMNDIFRTQVSKSYTESDLFYQTAERRRDPQIVRLNFSYRFGKFDVNLFKRKNTKADQNTGTDMGAGMGGN